MVFHGIESLIYGCGHLGDGKIPMAHVFSIFFFSFHFGNAF